MAVFSLLKILERGTELDPAARFIWVLTVANFALAMAALVRWPYQDYRSRGC